MLTIIEDLTLRLEKDYQTIALFQEEQAQDNSPMQRFFTFISTSH